MPYFVNIVIKSLWPLNVLCYFDSSTVRSEGIYVKIIIREILPCPVDAHICLTFINKNERFQWNSKKYSIDNDYLWNTAVNFYFFLFLEIKIHQRWDRSFIVNKFYDELTKWSHLSFFFWGGGSLLVVNWFWR